VALGAREWRLWPRFDHSWEAGADLIRIYQTVSLRGWVNKGRKKGRAATPDLPNSLRKIRILHEYYRRGAEDTDFSPWLLYCATVFREVGSLLLWSAAMEGTVGRRGCKPRVAIGVSCLRCWIWTSENSPSFTRLGE
jgi:hypothetical protein